MTNGANSCERALVRRILYMLVTKGRALIARVGEHWPLFFTPRKAP
jgi:hypothetical protein